MISTDLLSYEISSKDGIQSKNKIRCPTPPQIKRATDLLTGMVDAKRMMVEKIAVKRCHKRMIKMKKKEEKL